MDKVKIIFIAAVSLITVITIILLVFFSPFKNSFKGQPTTTLPKVDLTSFSEDFIRDFSTYSYKTATEYNKKIEKYIAPSYLQDFKYKFAVVDASMVPEAKRDNFSRYISSKIDILSEDSTRATISITYKILRKNAPAKPDEFTDEKTVTITVNKTQDKAEITSLQFSEEN